MRRLALLGLVAALLAPALGTAATSRPLKIGVTLHPYYSWTKNIVGDTPGVEVRGVLPGDIDAGDYQPRPDDIKKLADLDAIVINGIGHDDFILDMIKASGNKQLVVIRPNDVTPTMKFKNGTAVNSHTFISFGNAIQQTYYIEKELAKLRPEYAATFDKNAAEYARRLRTIKADAATKLAGATVARVVTVHDGYSYLLQEFGIDLAGVVEPAHGLIPSAKELGEIVAIVKKENVKVVLSEATFSDKLLQVLKDEGGVRVYIISHIATGQYAADKFEKDMQANVNALVQALVIDPKT
jgi:zinc transport system substrate-binding protein